MYTRTTTRRLQLQIFGEEIKTDRLRTTEIHASAMPSLVRPTKRQKQDQVSREVSTKPTVPEVIRFRDSSSLLTLVGRFAETHFTYSDELIKIIGEIRSNTYFLEYNGLLENSTSNLHDYGGHLSLRKLHGTLILYIGFILGSWKQTSKFNEKWEEVLSALVFCLRDLYTSNKGKLSKFSAEEELNELFVLVPKIVRNVSSKTCYSVNSSEVTVKQKINKCCFQIIKSWLNVPILLQKVLAKSTNTALENLLFSLLESKDISIIVRTNEQDESLEVLEQLRSLCNDNSGFRELLDVTLFVIESNPSSPRDHLSPRLTVFYWRCLSCLMFRGDTKNGKIKCAEIADRAVDSMMHYRTSNNRMLSRQAVSCIGEFLQISSHDRHTRLIQFETNTLLERNPHCDEQIIENNEENGKDATLIQTLQCLGFCMKRASSIDFFLQLRCWEKAFDNLVYLAEDDNDRNVAEKATMVLIPILKTLITPSKNDSSTLFRKSISVLLSLLSFRHRWIVGSTVELLFTVLQNSETRRRLGSSTLSPDLVNMLGELSSKNFFVEESKKVELAQTFSILINEIKNVNFLAGTFSNLTFLVHLANGSYCKTDQRRVQEISICTIMKLARNPCNQRILAKEPGLLSSLIRYTRITPEDTEVLNERRISRREMKDRIILIANAL